MRHVGPKNTIIVGLGFEMIQLTIYGFGNQRWMMWLAGGIASLGSITYPAISAFVSKHAETDQQGVAQGVLTGIRGLCNGLGPAMFGFTFYLFQVDLSGQSKSDDFIKSNVSSHTTIKSLSEVNFYYYFLQGNRIMLSLPLLGTFFLKLSNKFV